MTAPTPPAPGMDDASRARSGAPSPAAPAREPATLGATARRLAAFVRPYRAAVGLGVLAFFASAAVEPLVPALLKQLLDHGFRPEVGFPLWLVPLVVVLLFALRGVLAFCGVYLFASAGSRAVMDLRTALIASVMRADASLFVHLSPGVAAARVINDPQNATQALSGAITTLLRDGTTLVALLAYLFWLNWSLTLVSLATVPLLALVVRRVQRRVLDMGRRNYESQIRLVGIVDDIARAWRVVRSFDAGDFEARRFGAEAQRLRRTTLKTAAAGALMTPLTQIVASVGVAIILTLALLDAQRGGATVGDFVAFITAMLMTISPLRHLTDLSQPVIGGLIQARACFDLMDTPAEPDPGRRELHEVRGEIRLQGASVVYPGAESAALDGVDLHIEPGRTVALVGPSGAGKTSVVNALLGFAPLGAGRVLLDGVDVAEVRKASLRRQFAVVSQDIVLFDGSIADNVAYAQPRDAARIAACLRDADLWPFVQTLPEGLDAPVGSNGNRLSGGQRQRLAIARALYKDAPVWVFDEGTSALDSESERSVQASIERWHGRRTVILIAHRLSTVRHADRIVVLAHGRVHETGTHDELMRHGGLYAGMVRAQQLG